MDMSTCKHCGSAIIWARLPNGKMIPLDADPHPHGSRVLDDDGFVGPSQHGRGEAVVFEEDRYIYHFVTCSAILPDCVDPPPREVDDKPVYKPEVNKKKVNKKSEFSLFGQESV